MTARQNSALSATGYVGLVVLAGIMEVLLAKEILLA